MALGLRWWAGLGLVCGACGFARLLSACSGDSGGQPDATADQTVGCFTNLTSCLGSCVDLQGDPTNCGACGHACGTGQGCIQGSCVQTCGGGAALCGDACADLLGDPGNCGMCGNKCAGGQVCNDGGCALSCQTGYMTCANDAGVPTCINPQTNDYNCNGCGNVCGPGTRCEAGTCGITCQAGLSVCSEAVDASDGATSVSLCVDLIVDTNNCGACGNVCEGGTFCSPTDDAGDASCGLGCFGGSLLCSNRCVDPKIDPYNCGSCNFVCDGGSPSCVSGKCQ
jgi:Stigma-specific protein, Stig1